MHPKKAFVCLIGIDDELDFICHLCANDIDSDFELLQLDSEKTLKQTLIEQDPNKISKLIQ